MNTKTLQRQYDKLTPRERVRLILEAVKRGDESERTALQRTAPRAVYQLPHHHAIAEALQIVAHTHLIIQLNRALSVATLAHGAEDENAAYRAARIGAYALCVQADAWRAFCAELGIGPELAFLGFDAARGSLEFSEKIAREFAFTFEETRAEMVKDFGADVDVITPERALSDLRTVFNDLVNWWR
ncbi:MAG: hypothetical protein B6D41_12310 [Chloroflexi bacterium UTCFX4]|jgi:hypothetical protein|nr:MAG: hypothetical protein B6D41_12310 [Chloroflexi bacterium UTCFX4]